mmetsp:Transcript_98048/g.210312  ORF Transcript_98048/g.210312 Transcript_98048/m.210312 type:complete len:369 (+) Transcript_98048:67-1173(+)
MGSICSTPAGDNSAVEKVDQKSVEPEKEEVKEAMAPTGTESTIKVFGCRGLRNADWTWTGSQSDAYVICTEKADPEKVKAGTVEAKEPKVLKTTKCCPNSLEPIFDEEFEAAFDKDSILEFEVWDKDPLKPDDLLGKAELKCEKLAEGFNGELELAEAGKKKAYIKVLVKAPGCDYPLGPARTLSISLAKANKKFGFDFDDTAEDALFVTSIDDAGPAKEYNNQQEEANKQMKTGQFIVAVNDAKDKKSMVAELKKSDKVELQMVRPWCFTVPITKKGSLGLTVAQAAKSNLVKVIGEGPFAEWNKSNTDKEKEVKAGDRIVAVNGDRAQGKAQMALLKKDGPLHIVFCRQRPEADIAETFAKFWDWF